MRERPHAFLRLGNRWINMTMVTDIEDHGDELRVFVSAEMARLAGKTDPQAIGVARRLAITDVEEVDKLRRWLKLNDVE